MKLSPVESAIHEFLATELLNHKKLADLDPDDSLFERGLLDSLSIIKTVAFCERTFDISIPDEEVLPDNFGSVRAIAKLVERQRARR